LTKVRQIGSMGELVARLFEWLDKRLGLSNGILRPVPEFSMNPSYWLGALMVVAFLIQGVTGFLMLLYYVPTPELAYPTTKYIANEVPYGLMIETLHLYTAYAMILLAFAHMMRAYFLSVHKRPRELMWIIGMLMGLISLAFGFTGYLLPWTVLSKTATDVSIGILLNLPSTLAELARFLIVGPGGDEAMLLRFYDLHILLLPAALALLVVVKFLMLESHGIAEPPTARPADLAKNKAISWFPKVALYLAELGAVLTAALLAASALFPLKLLPEFTPQAAAAFIPEPEWYFIWVYHTLKISVFEREGLPYALFLIGTLAMVLVFLPIFDRGQVRDPRRRPLYVTVGVVITAELVALTFWGYLTLGSGRNVPVRDAVAVLGSIALLAAAATLGLLRVWRARTAPAQYQTPYLSSDSRSFSSASHANRRPSPWKAGISVTLLFMLPLSAGALLLSWVSDALQSLAESPYPATVLGELVAGIFLLACASYVIILIVYRLERRRGTVTHRISSFESRGKMGDV